MIQNKIAIGFNPNEYFVTKDLKALESTISEDVYSLEQFSLRKKKPIKDI